MVLILSHCNCWHTLVFNSHFAFTFYFCLRCNFLDSNRTLPDVPQWEESRNALLRVQYEILKCLFQTKSGTSLYPKRQLLTLLLPAVFYRITLKRGKIVNHHFSREARGTEELQSDHRGPRVMETSRCAGSHRWCLQGKSLTEQLHLLHSSETVHHPSLKVFL